MGVQVPRGVQVSPLLSIATCELVPYKCPTLAYGLRMSNYKVFATVAMLMFTVVGCAPDKQNEEASALVVAKSVDHAEALEIVKATCRENEGNFYSKQILDDFTQAARLDDQYSDEVAVLLYFKFLTGYRDPDTGISILAPEGQVDLSYPMMMEIAATCKIAGVDWKLIDWDY